MRSTGLFIAAVALLGPALAAQNIIKNGDFENGSTSWTASGGGKIPGVTSFNVAGTGSSNCYGVHADRVGAHIITQNAPILNGLTYEITMDLTQKGGTGNNAQGVAFEVHIGGRKVGEWTKGTGSILAGVVDRERLCVRVLVNWTTSFTVPVQVHFIRPRFTAHAGTPRGMVDNIDVRIATEPIVCPRGERKLGGTLNLEMMGTANTRVGLFVAATNMAPVAVPGFVGTWELNGAIPLLFGTLDGAGLLKQAYPIPNNAALDGAFLWWQGISALPTPSLGPAHKFGVYK